MHFGSDLMVVLFFVLAIFAQLSVAGVMSGIFWTDEWQSRRLKAVLSIGLGQLVIRSLSLLGFEVAGWKTGWTIEFHLDSIHGNLLQLATIYFVLLAPMSFILLAGRLPFWGRRHHVPMALALAFLGTYMLVRAYGGLVHMHYL